MKWPRTRRALREHVGLALVILAIALATALYAPTLSRGLVNYDDAWLVRDNFVVDSADVRTIFFDTSPETRFILGAEYLPIRDLSIVADHALWGTWYPGYHLTNLLLYLVALALWAAALFRFGVDRRLVGLAILLWALHPTHAESVAWISERKGLLALAWCGLAAFGYATYRAKGRPWWLMVCALAAAAAIWSKAPAAMMLAALPVLELVLPERRASRAHAWRGIAAIAIAGGLAFIPVVMTALGLSIVGTGDHAPTSSHAMALGLHGFYLELGALAFRNAIAYPIATQGPSDVQIVVGAVGLIAILIVAVVPGRGWFRPPGIVRAAALIWLLGWLPASRLLLPLKAVIVSDRYMLFATLGFAIGVAWLLLRISSTRARAALVSAICVASAARTLDAQSNWRDSPTLWRRAVQSNPYDGDAWGNYVEALQGAGEHAVAVDMLAKGVRRAPTPKLLFVEASFVLQHGDHGKAVTVMRHAAEGKEPRAQAALATLLAADGKQEEALAWARKVTLDFPMYPRGFRVRGVIAAANGQRDEAALSFQRAHELWPPDMETRLDLAQALIEKGSLDEARPHLAACLFDPRLRMRALTLLARIAHRGSR